ncbi:MAG: tetratricopeptide repeat protein [Tepidisphaeraceae bacterium]
MAYDPALQRAFQLFQTGQFAQAEGECRQLLAKRPNHADALQLLGLLANRVGKAEMAVEFLRKAIAADPRVKDYYNNLGVILTIQGRLEEARGTYHDALALDPDNVEFLNNLAIASHRANRLTEALDAAERAVALKPDFAAAHCNKGKTLHGMGKLEEALAAFHRALALKPDLAEAQASMGALLNDLGRPDEALTACRRALEIQPNLDHAHNNLGNALIALERADEALVAYQRAIQIEPKKALFHYNAAIAHQNLGQALQSIEAYHRAVSLEPNYPKAFNNLGVVLLSLHRFQEALDALQRAVTIKPDYAEAWNNLGDALRNLGRSTEAIEAIRRALTLKPDDAKPANNLGLALISAGRPEEAVDAFRRAIASDPNDAEIYNNLGNVLKDIGPHEEAIEVLQRAMAIDPKYASPYNNLAIVLMNMGRIEESLETYRRAVDLDPSNASIHSNLVLSLHYLHGNDGAATLSEARRWNSRHGEPLRKTIAPHANSRDPDRRLRIGHISNDFREHSVSRFLQPLFQNHDHERCEIVGYSDVWSPDSHTALLRGCANQWHDIIGKSDESVAEMIRGHGIDILVDLMGHTARNRLLVFARKPAPVQISYLGYPGTTGLATMDYRLTDALADPPRLTEAFHCETLIRLAKTNWCFAPLANLPDVGPLPASQGQPICFGSFNRLAKLSPQTLDLWAAMLRAIPNSRLSLKDISLQEQAIRDHVHKSFNARGIGPERLELVGPKSARADHFRSYGEVDIALDPFPYHGTTTSCEALWMGVPMVTLAGTTHVARVGVSLLSNLGLPDLIARTEEEYLSIAVGLANDLPRLAEIRRTLRDRMKSSPLMNGREFARDVEAAYRDVWRRWCAGGSR